MSNGSVGDWTKSNRGLFHVHIYLRQDSPTANIINQGATVKFDAPAGYDGLRVGFWPTSPGTDANQLTLTDQTGWTYNEGDADNPYWEGNINLLTDAITTWLNGECDATCYFAVNLVSGADLYPVFDQKNCAVNFTIYERTDPGSGNGTNMTGAIPMLPLPTLLGPDSNGKIWRIDGISGSPPTLDITCINP